MLTEFPKTLCHLTMDVIKQKKLTGYPPIQQQRWNSIHDSLLYVIKNIESLSEVFPDASVFKTNSYFLEVEEALKPLHDFTNILEGDDKDQADVFVEFRKLTNRWKELKERKNTCAGKLLKYAKERCLTTIDINLSETIFYFTAEGMNEFARTFQYKPLHLIDNDEDLLNYKNRANKISFVEAKIKQLQTVWNLNVGVIIEIFKELTQEEREYTKKYLSDHELFQFFPTKETDELLPYLKFLQRIEALPASEVGLPFSYENMNSYRSESCINMKI